MQKWLNDTLHIIAYTTLVLFGPKLLKFLYNIIFVHLLNRPKDLRRLAGTDANWAVITGGSDGIGAAYAFELAARGFDVIIISRSQQKLDVAKAHIEGAFPIRKLKTITFDFGKATFDDYNTWLLPQLKDLEVGVLVNNVGQMHDYPDILHEHPGELKKIFEVTSVNTLPVTILTAHFLKQMTLRGAGVIVNLSSASGYHEMPKWAVYSSTKRFVLHFTRCLVKEYSSFGITIQAVTPMFVATDMTSNTPTMQSTTPEAFVKSAIKTIGRTSETAGYLSHEFQAFGLWFPGFWVDPFVKILSESQKVEALSRPNILTSKNENSTF